MDSYKESISRLKNAQGSNFKGIISFGYDISAGKSGEKMGFERMVTKEEMGQATKGFTTSKVGGIKGFIEMLSDKIKGIGEK